MLARCRLENEVTMKSVRSIFVIGPVKEIAWEG